MEEAKEELKVVSSFAQNPEDNIVELGAPVLDLGNTEILLDMDENLEPESPELSQPPAQSEELEIKLEIDESDGPLTINDDEIPKI
jgi:hypothetical protein